jgi:protein-tyrosine phosphatase
VTKNVNKQGHPVLDTEFRRLGEAGNDNKVTMAEQYSRHIRFENVTNFRDLGGYLARDGYMIAWRRIFRSGDPRKMTATDAKRIKEELGIATVIDLRTPTEFEQRWEIDLLKDIGVRYYNIPFLPDNTLFFKEEQELYSRVSNMGEVYLHRLWHKSYGKRVVESLEIIAKSDNHPLVFHCGVGKDRTGILAAILLAAIGVADEDIIEDYTLTAPFIIDIRNRVMNDPKTPEDIKNLPDFAWEAAPESMASLLATLRQEYGSITGYLQTMGADASLVPRLEGALLV